ncbi:hypothetical protein, partial [Dyadobacter pollutisoli]
LVASTFLVMLILGTCSDVRTFESVEDKQFKNALNEVVKKADLKLKKGERAFFRLDTLTKFKWDKMYSIPGNVLKREIEKQIGIPWEFGGGMGFITEGNLLLIFIKDKKVVSTVEFIDGDKRFVPFSIGVLGENMPYSKSSYFIYKQFYAKDGYNIQVVPTENKEVLPDSELINNLRTVSLD